MIFRYIINMKETKRLFLAIPIPELLKKQLLRFQMANAHLEQKNEVNWVPDQNFHVTLFFLSDVLISDISALEEKLEKLFYETNPFELEFNIFCTKPSSSPRMIWAQFQKSKNFTMLYRQVFEVGKNFINAEKIDLHDPIPHITLARIKRSPRDLSLKNEPKIYPKILVQEIELWESELQKGGARYTPFKKFSFEK